MIPYKNVVRDNFSNASTTYDSAADFHELIADHVLELINMYIHTDESSKILEIGCGTGILSQKLIQLDMRELIINDLSQDMINVAKQKICSSKVTCLCDDAESMDLEMYDLVVSSMAFQWLNDIELFLNKIKKHTNQCVFSTLLDTTFSEWRALCARYGYYIGNNYKTFDEMCELFNEDIIAERRKYVMNFENVLEFLRYLKSIGAQTYKHYNGVFDLTKIIKENTGAFSVSYDVFFCVV